MAEDENVAAGGEPLSNGEDTAPAMGLLSQYVKDLSFENPNAPAIYSSQIAPQLDVQIGLQSAQVGEEVFEVVLKIDARAQMETQTAWVLDLSYAGLFGIRNVPPEQIEPFLLIQAPTLIFPFARRILADALRDGGFPPFLLEPIDFHGLYVQNRMNADAQGAEAGQA